MFPFLSFRLLGSEVLFWESSFAGRVIPVAVMVSPFFFGDLPFSSLFMS